MVKRLMHNVSSFDSVRIHLAIDKESNIYFFVGPRYRHWCGAPVTCVEIQFSRNRATNVELESPQKRLVADEIARFAG